MRARLLLLAGIVVVALGGALYSQDESAGLNTNPPLFVGESAMHDGTSLVIDALIVNVTLLDKAVFSGAKVAVEFETFAAFLRAANEYSVPIDVLVDTVPIFEGVQPGNVTNYCFSCIQPPALKNIQLVDASNGTVLASKLVSISNGAFVTVTLSTSATLVYMQPVVLYACAFVAYTGEGGTKAVTYLSDYVSTDAANANDFVCSIPEIIVSPGHTLQVVGAMIADNVFQTDVAVAEMGTSDSFSFPVAASFSSANLIDSFFHGGSTIVVSGVFSAAMDYSCFFEVEDTAFSSQRASPTSADFSSTSDLRTSLLCVFPSHLPVLRNITQGADVVLMAVFEYEQASHSDHNVIVFSGGTLPTFVWEGHPSSSLSSGATTSSSQATSSPTTTSGGELHHKKLTLKSVFGGEPLYVWVGGGAFVLIVLVSIVTLMVVRRSERTSFVSGSAHTPLLSGGEQVRRGGRGGGGGGGGGGTFDLMGYGPETTSSARFSPTSVPPSHMGGEGNPGAVRTNSAGWSGTAEAQAVAATRTSSRSRETMVPIAPLSPARPQPVYTGY